MLVALVVAVVVLVLVLTIVVLTVAVSAVVVVVNVVWLDVTSTTLSLACTRTLRTFPLVWCVCARRACAVKYTPGGLGLGVY